MIIKLKNYEIDDFGQFLLSLPLKGKQSRLRSRFIKLLQERALQVQEEQMAIINEYVKKDEQGKPKRKMKNGQEVWDIKDGKEEEFQEQMREIAFEDCIIEITAEREEMYQVVRDAVLNCDKVFSGEEAIKYDRFCDIIEGLGD